MKNGWRNTTQQLNEKSGKTGDFIRMGKKKLNAVSIIWRVEMTDIYFNLMEDTKQFKDIIRAHMGDENSPKKWPILIIGGIEE